MFVLTVPSDDQSKTYTVRKAGDVWVCDCADHVNRSKGQPFVCKHIAEVVASLVKFATTATKSKRAQAILEG